MTPDSALQLQKLGYDCLIEAGAGMLAGFTDDAYRNAGVTVVAAADALWDEADVIAKVRPPETSEAERLKAGKTLISFFYPAQNKELLELCKDKGADVIAMDMVPRISRAQKMDALSSMANIAGYRAVIEAGNNFGRFFTGQITAAGKVPPAKVLVVGAGVAGLAAIGTATSLGAITYAFDVRPEVSEQIESMGAQFVFLDFKGQQQDGATTGGYAAPSSPEFREAQLKKFRELAPERAGQSKPEHAQIRDRAPECIDTHQRAIPLDIAVRRDGHPVGHRDAGQEGRLQGDQRGDRRAHSQHGRGVVHRARRGLAVGPQIERPEFAKLLHAGNASAAMEHSRETLDSAGRFRGHMQRDRPTGVRASAHRNEA